MNDQMRQLQAIAIAEAIQSLGEVPAGHLYAHVMNHMSLEVFERIVGALVRSGVVTRKNHLLTWTGPRVKES